MPDQRPPQDSGRERVPQSGTPRIVRFNTLVNAHRVKINHLVQGPPNSHIEVALERWVRGPENIALKALDLWDDLKSPNGTGSGTACR